MRRTTVMAMAIAATLLFAAAGVSFAGGAGHSWKSSGDEMSGPAGRSAESEGTLLDNWEHQLSIETGSLPAGPGSRFNEKAYPGGEEIAVIESGGLFYRVGVDTQ